MTITNGLISGGLGALSGSARGGIPGGMLGGMLGAVSGFTSGNSNTSNKILYQLVKYLPPDMQQAFVPENYSINAEFYNGAANWGGEAGGANATSFYEEHPNPPEHPGPVITTQRAADFAYYVATHNHKQIVKWLKNHPEVFQPDPNAVPVTKQYIENFKSNLDPYKQITLQNLEPFFNYNNQGNTAQGNTTQGNITQGNTAQGNTAQGNTVDYNTLASNDLLSNLVNFRIGDQTVQLRPKSSQRTLDSLLNYLSEKEKNRIYEESFLLDDSQKAALLKAKREAAEPSTIDKFTQILGLGKDIASVTSYITGDRPEELWDKVTSGAGSLWDTITGSGSGLSAFMDPEKYASLITDF